MAPQPGQTAPGPALYTSSTARKHLRSKETRAGSMPKDSRSCKRFGLGVVEDEASPHHLHLEIQDRAVRRDRTSCRQPRRCRDQTRRSCLSSRGSRRDPWCRSALTAAALHAEPEHVVRSLTLLQGLNALKRFISDTDRHGGLLETRWARTDWRALSLLALVVANRRLDSVLRQHRAVDLDGRENTPRRWSRWRSERHSPRSAP